MVFNAFSSEVAEISRGRKKERRGGGVGGEMLRGKREGSEWRLTGHLRSLTHHYTHDLPAFLI